MPWFVGQKAFAALFCRSNVISQSVSFVLFQNTVNELHDWADFRVKYEALKCSKTEFGFFCEEKRILRGIIVLQNDFLGCNFGIDKSMGEKNWVGQTVAGNPMGQRI